MMFPTLPPWGIFLPEFKHQWGGVERIYTEDDDKDDYDVIILIG